MRIKSKPKARFFSTDSLLPWKVWGQGEVGFGKTMEHALNNWRLGVFLSQVKIVPLMA